MYVGTLRRVKNFQESSPAGRTAVFQEMIISPFGARLLCVLLSSSQRVRERPKLYRTCARPRCIYLTYLPAYNAFLAGTQNKRSAKSVHCAH